MALSSAFSASGNPLMKGRAASRCFFFSSLVDFPAASTLRSATHFFASSFSRSRSPASRDLSWLEFFSPNRAPKLSISISPWLKLWSLMYLVTSRVSLTNSSFHVGPMFSRSSLSSSRMRRSSGASRVRSKFSRWTLTVS